MKESEKSNHVKSEVERAIEIAIRIGILGLLLLWCFQILPGNEEKLKGQSWTLALT